MSAPVSDFFRRHANAVHAQVDPSEGETAAIIERAAREWHELQPKLPADASQQIRDAWARANDLQRTLSETMERADRAERELAEWKHTLSGWGGSPAIIDEWIKGQQARIYAAQTEQGEVQQAAEELRQRSNSMTTEARARALARGIDIIEQGEGGES